jgi:hypothetical protein
MDKLKEIKKLLSIRMQSNIMAMVESIQGDLLRSLSRRGSTTSPDASNDM